MQRLVHQDEDEIFYFSSEARKIIIRELIEVKYRNCFPVTPKPLHLRLDNNIKLQETYNNNITRRLLMIKNQNKRC